MEERRYTVAEIDALRRACRDKVVWGRFSGPNLRPGQSAVSSRSFQSGEAERQAEDMVRTHMLSGHTADELRASDE